MGISGRSETFSQSGKIDNADLQFSDTKWELKEGKRSGKESVRLTTVLLDKDGGKHPWNWVALGGSGMGTRLTVDDGKLVTVDDDNNEVDGGAFSDTCGAAVLFASMEKCGFSPKVLAKIGDEPDGLDGNWFHFEQKPSGRKGDDGKEFSDLIVTEQLDEDEVMKGGSKKATGKARAAEDEEEEDDRPSAAKKSAKRAAEEEEDDEESEEEDEDSEDEGEGGDEVQDAADTALSSILDDPSEFVKNYNAKKNDGGITVKELYTTGFSVVKGKNKGEVTTLLKDAKYIKGAAKRGLCLFDEDEGVIYPPKRKKGR